MLVNPTTFQQRINTDRFQPAFHGLCPTSFWILDYFSQSLPFSLVIPASLEFLYIRFVKGGVPVKVRWDGSGHQGSPDKSTGSGQASQPRLMPEAPTDQHLQPLMFDNTCNNLWTYFDFLIW